MRNVLFLYKSIFLGQENLGQKLKISLAAGPAYYHVIGHVSQVIQLDKTDLGRLLNSATPHSEDTHQSTVQTLNE